MTVWCWITFIPDYVRTHILRGDTSGQTVSVHDKNIRISNADHIDNIIDALLRVGRQNEHTEDEIRCVDPTVVDLQIVKNLSNGCKTIFVLLNKNPSCKCTVSVFFHE
jgi:hypothetical protein